MVNDSVYNEIINIIENELDEFNLECAGSEMLLLALISLKDSMTSLIFKELNISKEDIKKIIKESCLLRKDGVYTTKFYEIIKHSETLMSQKEYAYDEAYLYSILEIPDTIAKDLLKRLGVDESIIYDELENAREYLEKDSRILVNMTRLAREGKLNPFIGRFNYIDKIDRILSRKQKNNPMLIGAAGVGKSGLVEGVAQYYLTKNPKALIYRLDLSTIIAGTRYRGDLEERLLDAIEELKEANAIVFIDEIHNILSSNTNEASLDIANILKPVLSRSEIKCIGATTTEEYYRFVDKDKALVRRFQNIFVDEVNNDECFDILKGIKQGYVDFYNVEYSDEVLKYIIEVSKLMTNRKLPDKAIDLLDESGLITKRNEKENVTKDTIDELIFENIGINRPQVIKNLKSKLKYPILKKYFEDYLNLKSEINIINIQCTNSKVILEEIKRVFLNKDESILEIDLEDFVDNHYSSNLIGSPSGYVGYDNGGILTEHLVKHPFSVVVFKNYLGANHLIKGIIKRSLGSGTIVDNKNRNISLKNTIFVFEVKDFKQNVGFVGVKLATKIDTFINELLD